MALDNIEIVRTLARDCGPSYRYSIEHIQNMVELMGSPYQAALALVHQDIARLAQEGTITSKSIADQSYSKQYSLGDLRAYADWLDAYAKRIDPLSGGGEIPSGVVMTEVPSLFGVGMHDEPNTELSSYAWETL